MVVLTNTSPIFDYEFRNNTTLWDHQKRELNQMRNMESPSYIINNKTISTYFGVLASKSGSGKTTSILALIQSTYNDMNFKEIISTNGCEVATITSYVDETPFRYTNSTLIIIPNYLKSHWINEINRCGMTYSLEQVTDQDPICLLTSNAFNRFYINHRNYNFKRIVIDEADTIKIPLERYLNNQFIWFVSGTSTKLFYMSKFRRTRALYSRYFSAFKNHWMDRLYFTVETDENIVTDNLFRGRNIQTNIIECLNHFNDNIRITPITRQYINNKKYNVALINMNFDFLNMKDTYKLETNTNENIYKNIKEKIDNINNEDNPEPEACVICYNNFKGTNSYVVSKCCGNLFCSECVCKFMNTVYTECPYCRTGNFDLTLIGNDEVVKIYEELKVIPSQLIHKEKQLVKLIENSKDKKFLVFSIWDYEFFSIIDELYKNDIRSRVLCGKIDKVIQKHNRGEFQVLLANEFHCGAGLNLPWITDLVIYSKQSVSMEKYFIHKILSNRSPTTPELNVHYLNTTDELLD
jgi:hypothetical protein